MPRCKTVPCYCPFNCLESQIPMHVFFSNRRELIDTMDENNWKSSVDDILGAFENNVQSSVDSAVAAFKEAHTPVNDTFNRCFFNLLKYRYVFWVKMVGHWLLLKCFTPLTDPQPIFFSFSPALRNNAIWPK